MMIKDEKEQGRCYVQKGDAATVVIDDDRRSARADIEIRFLHHHPTITRLPDPIAARQVSSRRYIVPIVNSSYTPPIIMQITFAGLMHTPTISPPLNHALKNITKRTSFSYSYIHSMLRKTESPNNYAC
jgi:hypothetical protein